MTFIAASFYLGGMQAAYSLERSTGRNRFMSAMDAIFWPMGLGCYVARSCYVLDRDR